MKKKLKTGLFVSFDIGSVSIKATVVEISDKGRRLAAIEEELLKPISAYPGEEEFRAQIVDSLKHMATRLPLQQSNEITALYANRELQVKIIELPSQVQPDQLDKLLNWEAKKLLSPAFREEPYAFSYKILRKAPYSVAVAVVPQRLLERFTELFEKAGISLTGTYTEVFAAHELKEIVDISGLPALSIVNFGHSGTHLQIFSAGELKFYRFIPSGLSDMSDPPTENELEMYSQKIRFSFDYFRAVSKLNHIDILYFMGGGASQHGVLPFERNYFNPTKVGIVDVSSGLDISPVLSELRNDQPAEEKQRRLLPFLPALGACLAGLAEDAGHMNLSGRLNSQKREIQMAKLAGMLPLWIGLGGMFVAVIALLFLHGNMQKELEGFNEQLSFIRMNTEAVSIKLNKQKAATENSIKLSPQAAKLLTPTIKSRGKTAETLFHVVAQKPEALNIEKIMIRTELEAESTSIGDSDSDPIAAGEEEAPAKFTGQGGNRVDNDEQQLREGLKGEILIVRGNAQNLESIGEYTENLTRKQAIRRVKSLNTRKGGKTGFEFLLKGVLP